MTSPSDNGEWTRSDYRFMARAIQLAKKGLYSTHPNPRVGCVITKDDQIISEGWHIKAGDAHAEIHAINNAKEPLNGARCYVSLEPCSFHGKTPPCAEALLKSGITNVIAAMVDPNPRVSGQGIEFLKENNVSARAGLLSNQAEAVNPGFIKRMKEGLPYVRCKLASSLDGKVSLSNGVSQWITSSQSRQDVQKLRAMSSAVITGIGTVLADDPSLNVRDVNTEGRQPIRVVMDSHLRTPETAGLFSLQGDVVILTIAGNVVEKKILTDAGAEVVQLDEMDLKVDLQSALKYLASEKEVNEILLEAGPELAASMLKEQLVDELIVYQAPLLMGDKARGMMPLDDLKAMNECVQLELIDRRFLGQDERSIFRINY